MTWQSDEAFLEGLDFFSEVVAQVPSERWSHPSACSGWSALDVLGHVGGVVKFGTALINGEKPAWGGAVASPGSAIQGGDPASWWSALVGPARSAVSGADLAAVIDSPMGPRSIGEGLAFPAADCFVHAWDIAHPLGISVEVPAQAIEFAHKHLSAIPAEQLRSANVFAGEVTVDNEVSESDRFIAWTGRDPIMPLVRSDLVVPEALP